MLVAPVLIFLFELEDRFDRLPEGTCDLECEQGRGDELAAFDGIDRLAADADLFGQLLLGEADDGSLDTQPKSLPKTPAVTSAKSVRPIRGSSALPTATRIPPYIKKIRVVTTIDYSLEN